MTAGKTQPGVDSTGVLGKGEGDVPLSLWRVIRRRRWKIAVGVVVGLMLGLLFGVLTGPWYESTAEMLVIKKQPSQSEPISGQNREARQDDYLSTHMLLITSPQVVERAVKTEQLETLRCFSRNGVLHRAKSVLSRLILGPGRPITEQERVTQEIVDSLIVSRDAPKPGTPPSNEVMIVAFRGKDANDCKKVLDAVIASYKSLLKETYCDVNAETLKSLEKTKEEVQKDLKAKEAAFEKLVRGPDKLLAGKDGSTPDKIKAQLTEVWRQQFRIQALLKQIDAALKEGRSEAEVIRLVLPMDMPILALLPNADKSGTNSSLDARLLELRLKEKGLLRDYGPNNREVLAVREEIKNVESLIKPPPGPNGETKLTETMQSLARLKIGQLRAELKQYDATEKGLNERLTNAEADAAASIRNVVDRGTLDTDIQRCKVTLDNIDKRISELKSVDQFSGYYTRALAAPDFGRWVLKKILFTFGFSLLLGLLIGFGWAYRVDVGDRSFRKAEEIRQALGWRVLGHIPVLGKARKEAAAEAFRAVRTALYFTLPRDAKRIIQVTGPNQGVGKTTLTAHLAASIAQSGKQVLVVDADLRKPCQHKIYSVANDIGLTTVLAGRAGAREAIQPTPIPGLSLLPSGPLGRNPAELLSSPRLGELLGSLRDQYDYVLIDTPPLLAVTDPSIIAHHVDGVLLVIRLTRRSRPHAQVAKEVLVSAGADVLGVVVNGVPRRSGPDSLIYECYPLGVAYEGVSA